MLAGVCIIKPGMAFLGRKGRGAVTVWCSCGGRVMGCYNRMLIELKISWGSRGGMVMGCYICVLSFELKMLWCSCGEVVGLLYFRGFQS